MTTNRRPVSAQRRAAMRRKRHRQVIRNRIIFAIACLSILGAMIFGIFKLVGVIADITHTASTSTLTFSPTGEITFEELTDFNQNDYSKRDLKKYSKKLVSDYNLLHEDAVELKKIKIKDDSCYIKSTYTDCDVYSDFSSYYTYFGKVPQAVKDEINFDTEFAQVVDGQKQNAISADIATEYKDCYVAIVEENVDVIVPGDIVLVSNASTDVVSSNEVVISQSDGNNDARDCIYIIFSMKN